MDLKVQTFVLGNQKKTSLRDGSFEYPQHMFWLRNKKIDPILTCYSKTKLLDTVNVLTFRTLVACLKGFTNSTEPDQSASDKHFVNSSPDNQHFICEKKEKVFKTIEHLPVKS